MFSADKYCIYSSPLSIFVPNGTNPNLVPIGESFGFVLLFAYPNFNAKTNKLIM